MANVTITSASVAIGVSASQQNLLNDGRTISESVGAANLVNQTLTNGAEVGKVDRAYQLASIALTAGTSTVLDLSDLTDVGAGSGNLGLGISALFREIVTFLLVHVGGTGELTVEPDTTNGWTQVDSRTGVRSIGANGAYLLHNPDEDGMPVTPASNCRVKVSAVTANVTFSLYVLGRSDTEVSSSSSTSSTLSSSSTSSTLSSSSTISSSSSSTISSSSSTSSTLSSSSSSTSSTLSSSSSSSTLSSSSSSTSSTLSSSSSSSS